MRTAMYLLAFGFAVLASTAEAQSERLNIVLENVRFQALPREVRRVHVGPDGRTWFTLDAAQLSPGRTAAEGVSAFKNRLAREFAEKSPQIYGGDLALFEPGGRVWCFLPPHSLLLGYDGKTWIDHPLPDVNDRVVGSCLTRGGCTAGRANRFAQDACWFVCARGILRFDGKEWSLQTLSENPPPSAGSVVLAFSPDGKTAAACQTSAAAGAATYWLHRNGRWISCRASANDPRNPGGNRRLASIALADEDTLWLAYSNGQLECAALGVEEPPVDDPAVAELIGRLADDDFAARQRATRELLARGSSIKPQLEKALKGQLDPERDFRLKLILQSFLPKPAAPGRTPPSDFGGVQVMYARQLFQDPAGKVGVIAQTLRDAESRQGSGIALLQGDGRARAIFPKNVSFAGFNYQNENLPVVLDEGRRAWWPRNLAGKAVQLLDAESGEFIDAAPAPLFGGVQAVSAEGRVFLARINAASGGERIAVYTPGAPETRAILNVESLSTRYPQFALTDDGAAWALERELTPTQRVGGYWGGKLVRYDGKGWRTPEFQPTQMVRSLTPGKGGVLLVQTSLESILYRGEKLVAAGDPVELIEKHRELFRTSFGPDMPPSAYDPNSRQLGQVLADKAGNIWRLEEGGGLMVLAGERWQSAQEALVAAGSPDGTASYIVPLGDGQKIYVADRGGKLGGLGAFFGEVRDGKLRFSQAPKIEIRDNDALKVRDAEGAIWAISLLDASKGSSREYIVRLGGEGVREKLEAVGTPRLVDAAGNLWVEKNAATDGCAYRLWRNGRWGRELAVPNVARNCRLVSDRPGSVYAWSNLGLQQLVADSPDFDDYRPGRLYALDDVSGEVGALACGKQGLLALLVQGGPATAPWTLGLLKLPEEKKELGGPDEPKR
ncbi:MAG: hypothetical protein IT426_02730 [Pirellulales bacterium]|nr:hypothetical protein [Pirellulales bacterium]